MKTNGEIRKEAWGIVRGKWFLRIFITGSLLYFIATFVSMVIYVSFTDMGIQTWTDFLQAKIRAFQSGLGYSVPSRAVFWQMTGATVFQQFIGYVFGSILVFGMVSVMLKAVRDDEKEWFAGAFGGFKRPLEVTWLLALMNLQVFLWGMLFVIPGIVAIYRYRQAWYLKCENPDWSAGKCLSESGRMMKGMKWKAFCLDLSFIVRFFLWAVACGCLVSGTLASAKCGSLFRSFAITLTGVVGFYFLVLLIAYLSAARTVFYKELACARA